jgi:hypothetical protein
MVSVLLTVAAIVAILETMSIRRDSAEPTGRVRRYDRGTLLPAKIGPRGELFVVGLACRPGVLLYRNADGTTRRELVSAAVLHDAASLQTLGRAPLTLQHPDEDVTPANVGTLQVGDVGDEVTVLDDGYVQVKIAVRRQDAIGAVHGGTHQLSCGYDAAYDPTPGVDPVYGPYEGRQTARFYNHLAIVDEGRAGPACRLRTDAAEQVGTAPLPTPGVPMDPKLLALLAMAGIAAADAEAFLAKCDPAVKAALAALAAKVSSEVEQDMSAPAAVAKMDAAIAERLPLVERARALGLPDAEFKGVKTADLRKKVALKIAPKLRTDGSDDYYRAALDVADQTAGVSTYDGLKGDADPAPPPRHDGRDGRHNQAARQDPAARAFNDANPHRRRAAQESL